MKKNNLNKIISCVVLVVLCAATVVGAWLGLAGRNTEYVTIHTENGDEKQALYRQVPYIPNTFNQSWKEALRPSADLGGGYSYTLTAEGADSATLKAAAKVLKARAQLISGNAITQVADGAVTVTVPDDSYNALLPNVFTVMGEYTFAFMDSATGQVGESVLTGEHVKQAYYSVNSNNGAYQVQVVFNSKGVKAIRDLIAANGASALYLTLDGQAIAYAILSEPTNGMLAFTANDWSSAFIATDCIRSGALPASMTLSASAAAEPASGLMNIVIIAAAIILLLVCVYLVVSCGLSGLAGVWALIAYVVCSSLLTALVAVSVSWVVTVPAMLGIVLCLCAFVYGLVTIFLGMSKQIRSGRGALAAYGDVCRRQIKPLGIVYGALLAIGLLLMIIFQRGIAGIMGRVFCLDAILSFVILFVFVRVVLSCAAALKGKK